MALNRAQMLVRDSEALAQFHVDHRIPDDVVIERPGPNDDADWVEGEGNRMPIRTWFIYQAGLRFPLSKLLRTVLSIYGLTFIQISVNFVRIVLAVEALMQREGLEFTAEDLFHEAKSASDEVTYRFPKQISVFERLYLVSGQWEFPTDEPDPFSVPRHRGYVPVGFNRRFWRRNDRCSAGHPVLPPLQIRGPGSRPRSSLSDEVSDLFEGTSAELRRLLEEAEGESSGSSESSSSGWNIDLGDEALNEEAKVEDGEEVDQVPAVVPLVPAPLVLVLEPINLPSSDSDIAIIELREIVEHSYSLTAVVHLLGLSSGRRLVHRAVLDGWQTERETARRGNLSTKKGKRCRISRWHPRAMGPPICRCGARQIVISAGYIFLISAKAGCGGSEEGEPEGEQPREGAEIAILQRNHAQQEASDLKAFTCGEVYKKLFDRAFEPARDIPLDHPAWSSPAPPIELPASPERYSPINLPDFNEEEYATLPADEGYINTAVVEAHTGVAETADRDRVGEAEGDRAVEAEGENLV
ncbi:hypothetical protein Acr_29g0010570 [Actinidia rufa]|uniref:Uncharacterized protein n=1 Tax=Actinidia rufa TaxID=165716 RepID=A0A7J0HFZ2_9ERIC|nr:hypothetical protein Acr_29g0010570 [Actinidia rufa]